MIRRIQVLAWFFYRTSFSTLIIQTGIFQWHH